MTYGPSGRHYNPDPTKEELLGDKINKHRGNAVIAAVILLVAVGAVLAIVLSLR